MAFDSYWQLEGALTTESPMHIGNGESEPHIFNSEEDSEPAEVQLFACDVNKKPVIPGSAIKGVLKRQCQDETASSKIFGEMESGGLVQFLDAVAASATFIEGEIERRTAIDAIRGTAKEHFLFAHKVVPEGTVFSVRIRGKSYEENGWKKHASLLNRGLADGVAFGAWNGNSMGRCRWALTAVRTMDKKALAEWLANPKPIDTALGALKDRKNEIETVTRSTSQSNRKRIQIELTFKDQGFLVIDPKKAKPSVGNEPGIAHGTRRTADGRIVLPTTGFRGVLAHRAAKITRTCGKSGDRQHVVIDNGKLPPDIGCMTRLFGGPGWKSVVEFEDFVEARPESSEAINTKVVQAVAVDRFTAAGGMDGRKFNAECGWAPKLVGAITINLDRLKMFGDITPSLGLLALVLRDLAEGDLTFGWGGGKGFGQATIDGGDACKWVESQLAGAAAGSAMDWICAWQKEGV